MASGEMEVLAGSDSRTEFVVCFACGEALDAAPDLASMTTLVPVLISDAIKLGIPATLPGPDGCWHLRDGEFERQPDIPDAEA